MLGFKWGPNPPTLCENCGVQPKYGGFDYCGKTCAVEAERKKKAGRPQSARAAAQPKPVVNSTASGPPTNTASKSTTCENCGTTLTNSSTKYCGEWCASAARYRNTSMNPFANASGPPNPATGQSVVSYGFTAGRNATTNSDMCENCYVRPKSRETDGGGTMITHPFCGINCYKGSQQSVFPVAPSAAPAVVSSSSDPVGLSMERTNTPMGRKISLMMQERWKSEEFGPPQLERIYRIGLSGRVSRRFDFALQMNDGCLVTTTYYGAATACSIARDNDPAPCGSESCGLCDALDSSFENLLYGASSCYGAYGPGLYTYINPALAHHVAVSDGNTKKKDGRYALLQCRVITQAGSGPGPGPYSGYIDQSGVVFCAQALAAIPTHVLIYHSQTVSNRPAQPPSLGVDDEDDEDDNFLMTDETLLRRPENRLNEQDDEEEDSGDELPDHPPGYHPSPRNRKLRGPKPILFYEENEKYYEFTNFAPYPVKFRGKEYPTSEHLFQARKFLDDRPDLAERIRLSDRRPQSAFNEAHKLESEVRPDWKEISIDIMEETLELKFTQHEFLRRLLLDTGDRYLIMNSGKDDDFWGNGADGMGRNELGLALMRLRSKLREKEPIAPVGKGKAKGKR